MDRYVLHERLGGGGAGEVYAAHDSLLDRPVAVKLLHTHLLDDPEPVARFQAEARASASLCHSGVVTVFDAGRFGDGRPFLVMERIDGRSLAETLASDGPLEEDRVLDVGVRIAEGLECAHTAGVVHRDVKPSNVLLAADGRVLLTDFGIARSLHSGDLTGVGNIVGTPAYLAPEVLRGERAGPSADVYGLGLTLYEALTGRRPFTGTSPMEIAIAHREQQPPPIRNANPRVSPETEAAILRALSKEPATRFPSAAAFADELRALLQRRRGLAGGLGAAATISAGAGPEPNTAPISMNVQPPPPTAVMPAAVLPPVAAPPGRRVPVGAVVLAGLVVLGLVVILAANAANRPLPAPAAISTSTTSSPTTAPAPPPPPHDLQGFTQWAATYPQRLGQHASEILGELNDVLDGQSPASLSAKARAWVSDGSLSPEVGQALTEALQPLLAPPSTEKGKGKGKGDR